MNVLIAPSGYKECLEADKVAAAIARGVETADASHVARCLPLVDGGEGFARGLADATAGRTHTVMVSGPLGQRVEAQIGELGDRDEPTFVVEVAQAAGLRLVPRDARDPMQTTTRGVGELIIAALDLGARRIIVGCGDSGTNDGGAGMAQALGCLLLDEHGEQIGDGADGLQHLARIDLSRRDPRLAEVSVEAALNITTRLCGPQGVARVFGPQKGADASKIVLMERALENYAAVVQRDVGIAVADMPGGGASGGLGAGLAALLGAQLRSRYDVVLAYFDLDEHLRWADLVLTAEGGIDLQTPHGKIPVEVARRAKQLGLPVIALAGQVDASARIVYDHGIDAYFSTTVRPSTLLSAMVEAEATLALTAENVMRVVALGQTLAGPAAPRGMGEAKDVRSA
jgi:glycerate 2-kinase